MESYRAKFGTAPRSIDDLYSRTNPCPLVDGWDRPYTFSSDGSNSLVTSYGRDGKPGGRGLDCDLTSKNPTPKEARLTFEQFLFEMHIGKVILICLGCGGIAGLLAFLTAKIPELNFWGLSDLAIKLTYITGGAIFVAGIISILHMPSGH